MVYSPGGLQTVCKGGRTSEPCTAVSHALPGVGFEVPVFVVLVFKGTCRGRLWVLPGQRHLLGASSRGDEREARRANPVSWVRADQPESERLRGGREWRRNRIMAKPRARTLLTRRLPRMEPPIRNAGSTRRVSTKKRPNE